MEREETGRELARLSVEVQSVRIGLGEVREGLVRLQESIAGNLGLRTRIVRLEMICAGLALLLAPMLPRMLAALMEGGGS